MKLMVGVLAVARCILARPEADPQVLLPPVAPAVVAAPLPLSLPVAHPVAHAPLVKSVVEVPAQVSHQVAALPLLPHTALPQLAAAAPVLSPGAAHVVKPFVHLKKREAEAEPSAEADADAYYYSSVSTPYASYGSFVPDYAPLPLQPVPFAAKTVVAAPVPVAAAPVAVPAAAPAVLPAALPAAAHVAASVAPAAVAAPV